MDGLVKQYSLSEEQREAFHYITQGSDISVVIGRPGTGKSYLLKPVNDYYTQAGYEVIGASLSGKVAKALEAETGICSSTIKLLSYRLANNMMQLNNKHVLIIDEAGMVDFSSMSYLIEAAKKAGSKVVLIGDPDQLKPIQKGEIFRGIAARTGYVELENIKRQQDAGDRQASLNLAKGEIDKAIQHYQDKQAITFANTTQEACEQLISDWKKDLETTDIADTILLSFTRKAVSYLNDQARETLLADQKIGQENIAFQGMERQLQISTGERLLFRGNNKTIGIRNGDTATVLTISSKEMKVKLDSGEILAIPKDYKALDYAYALTVHKSQGFTAKKVRVLIDSKYWDKSLSFVAMTRHKESLNLYADKENHPTEQSLKKTLSRRTIKDNVIDWPLDFASRKGFDTDSLINKVVNKIAGVGHKLKQTYNFIVNYETHLLKAKQQDINQSDMHNRSYAKQEAINMDAKENVSFDRYLTTKAFDQLKKSYPPVAELENLLQERKRKTGFAGEQLDKKLYAVSQALLINKQFVDQVKGKLPQLLVKIKNIISKQHERFLGHER